MADQKFPYHTLTQEYDLLEGQDFQDLVDSIKEKGQDKPIYIWRGQIVDGRNRDRACKSAGVKPNYEDKSAIPEEDLPDWLAVWNDYRRHDSPDKRADRRKKRIERVAKRRKRGESLRIIAKEEGVSEQQVRRDLEKAGATGVAPEPENGKVRGKDNKTYQTRKESSGKKNGANGTSSDSSGATPVAPEPDAEPPPPPTDALGAVLSPESVESFALCTKFDEALRLHRQLTALVDEIARSPGGEDFHAVCGMKERDGKQTFYLDALSNLAYTFKERRPYSARCPRCHSQGRKKNHRDCTVCQGLPYVSKWAWDSCNDDQRFAVEELAGKDGGACS